jgi:hypothetical protein
MISLALPTGRAFLPMARKKKTVGTTLRLNQNAFVGVEFYPEGTELTFPKEEAERLLATTRYFTSSQS